MATVSVPGFRGSLYMATSSSGGTIVKYGELAEVTLNLAMAAMDATSKDSAGWKENLVGFREWGLTGSGLYLLESTDPGQQAIMDALSGQKQTWVSLREAASSAQTQVMQEYQGQGIVTTFDVESPLEKPVGTKFALKGTGALTKQAATS